MAIPPAIKVSSMAFRIPARTHAPREILMEQPYGVRLVSDLRARGAPLFAVDGGCGKGDGGYGWGGRRRRQAW